MGSEASTLKYLDSLGSRGIRLDLGPVRRALARLGDPHRSYPSVLVAGTNGKGSISAMLASILREAGLKVGLYTSPHLIDFRERIRVNGAMISRVDLALLIEEVRERSGEDLTFFEFATVLAFMHFNQRKVDFAVLEVGMGGRLDATNVAEPEISIISNIALEHREYLGKTLELITLEKAGIVRNNGICLTGARKTAVIEALEGICRERNAALFRLGREIKVRSESGGEFSYFGLDRRYRHLYIPLKGRHQIQNAGVALGAVELLTARRGYPITDLAIQRGLEKTHWEGRLETIRENPTVVVDGAHNPDGMAALVKALDETFTYRKLIMIFGVLRDKEYRLMLRLLEPRADLLVLTGIRNARAENPQALARAAGMSFRRIVVKDNADDALAYALNRAGPGDLICAAGSLFLVGEIKKAVRNRNRQS